MTTGDVTIRQAGSNDFAAVAEMHYPAWRQSWTGTPPDSALDALGSPRRWAILAYPRILQRGNWSMWVAESGPRPIGMTIFGPDPANREQVELDSLSTLRRTGNDRASAAACWPRL